MKSNTIKKEQSFLAVRVKGNQKWRAYDKCCLGVSLGSPIFTGEKLSLIVDFINWNFKECLIDLSDTLNRHNLINDTFDEKKAKNICQKEGKNWIIDNQDILSRIKVPTTIIRWNHWLEHPLYNKYLDSFQQAYATNELFKEALDRDVQRFFIRQSSKGAIDHKEQFEELAKKYLLEELACHSILYEENQGYTNLYPGRQHDCYKVVRNKKIGNVPNGLQKSHYTRLLFYRSNAMNDNTIEQDNSKLQNPN